MKTTTTTDHDDSIIAIDQQLLDLVPEERTMIARYNYPTPLGATFSAEFAQKNWQRGYDYAITKQRLATDSELAQAYAQGYQDGRRGLEELIKSLRRIKSCVENKAMWPTIAKWTRKECDEAIVYEVNTALAKVATEEPKT